jgi:hypothetical protein
MAPEPISPELVLVDPDLGARARATLPTPAAAARAASGAPLSSVSVPAPAGPPADHRDRHYPAWARVTAALWLLVIGILVGGAAIPHAQDKPRVVPRDDDPMVTVCKPTPTRPPARHQGGI